MIKKLWYEQYKNFKIIFRNLSSICLLVLGPLALILLIGFAYSGEDVHGIKIGVVSPDFSVLEPAFQNFSTFAEIRQYSDIKKCIEDIKLNGTHICLEFSKDFVKVSGNDIPTGTITYYFDNSRKDLSNKLVDMISKYFGVTSEKISIESAKTIFANIQSLVVYLDKKNQDIVLLINESNNVKQDLLARKQKLVEVRDEFLPTYTKIKEIQESISLLSSQMDSAYLNTTYSMNTLDKELAALQSRISGLNANELYFYPENNTYQITENITRLILNNITFYNLSFYDYTLNGKSLQINFTDGFGNFSNISVDTAHLGNEGKFNLLTELVVASIAGSRLSINAFSNVSNNYYSYVNEQKAQFDNAIVLLDNVKDMLDSDISSTDEYIRKIDTAVVNVLMIQKELNQSMEGLAKLEPGLAEKLIKPILQNYEPILSGISNIQLAFPSLLAMIVVFISILLANIITLTELNSKAFFRNLIAPVDNLLFIIGLLITGILIVFFQISVLLLVGEFSFHIEIMPVVFPVLFIIGLLSLFFISIGMITAVAFKNQQTSILTTTFVALGFFMFSNAVFPLEGMPPIAAFFASKNPFVIATGAFTKLLVIRAGYPSILSEVKALEIYLLAAVVLLFVLTKRKLREGR